MINSRRLIASVRQTYSALSNLSLNIHGHLKVPKSKKNQKKSCSSAVISLYMSRFNQIKEFLSYLKGVKTNKNFDVFYHS